VFRRNKEQGKKIKCKPTKDKNDDITLFKSLLKGFDGPPVVREARNLN